ncbi:MAG TPA: TetR/AcrR family transcriptional regulator [Solirubrobacteraceae bacterium]|nr:TetR/AcrR family transcriptional regulator [Solirubrobacteraceae bacterium]
MATPEPSASDRRRVPAAERRDALIEAAVHEFAHGGIHGTPVDRIARRVGVAQPYVFSLFGSKRALFLAAVERGFQRVAETFSEAVATIEHPGSEEADPLKAMGLAYIRMLGEERDVLMLQHHAYAACGDPVVREHVRGLFAALIGHVQRLSGADQEQIDEFFRYGMWLNVAAAMGVEDLSSGCDWVRERLPEG